MVCVRDRALIGKHDVVGKSYIRLDPSSFGDLLPQDFELNLEINGRILLRVSMEGEKDEVGFYFGRAFRSLKRAESDMVKIFVEKVSAVFTNQEMNTNQGTSSDVTDDIPVPLSYCGQVLNQASHKHGIIGLQGSFGECQGIICIRSRGFIVRSTGPAPTFGGVKDTSWRVD